MGHQGEWNGKLGEIMGKTAPVMLQSGWWLFPPLSMILLFSSSVNSFTS